MGGDTTGGAVTVSIAAFHENCVPAVGSLRHAWRANRPAEHRWSAPQGPSGVDGDTRSLAGPPASVVGRPTGICRWPAHRHLVELRYRIRSIDPGN